MAQEDIGTIKRSRIELRIRRHRKLWELVVETDPEDRDAWLIKCDEIYAQMKHLADPPKTCDATSMDRP